MAKASRARKRHVQLDMLNGKGTRVRRDPSRRPKKLGRPKKPNAGSPHKVREAFKASSPIHVVLRVRRELGSLRRGVIYRAIRAATVVAGRHEDVRIVHLSIQRTHLHLLVEAEHRLALAKGMKAFQISAAKHVNATIRIDGRRRRGQVFADRYHAEIVRTPRQARHVLSYVMNNWRKHREDRVGSARSWFVDPFSTGVHFDGWRELGDGQRWPWRATYRPLSVWPPRTWLLTTGWRRHGLIGCREVPSSSKVPARRRRRTRTRATS